MIQSIQLYMCEVIVRDTNATSDPLDLFDFQWPKSVLGYKLQGSKYPRAEALSTSQILLDSGPRIARRGTEVRTYPPRSIDKLHRKFAAIGDTQDDVLEFVQIYGFLGLESPGQPSDIESESVSGIIEARNHMREALSSFDDLYREESLLKTAGANFIEDGEFVRRGIDAAPEQIAEVAFYSRQRAGELFNKWAAPNLVVRLRPGVTSGGSPRLTLRIEPRTLLASMWLQVAEELTGGARPRLCKQCGGPIKAGARSDKETCSDACRQAWSTSQRSLKKATKKSKQRKRGSK